MASPWRQLAVWVIGIAAHSAWELSQARGPRERRARLLVVALLWSGGALGFALGYGWRSATGERVPTWAVVSFVSLDLLVLIGLWLRVPRARGQDRMEREPRAEPANE